MGHDRRWQLIRALRADPGRDRTGSRVVLAHLADRDLRRGVRDPDTDHGLQRARQGQRQRRQAEQGRLRHQGFIWKGKAITCSVALAARSSIGSVKWSPISWTPTGSPSERPPGTLMAGMAARFAGTAQVSLADMARGSSTFSPISNATEGAVGESSTSKRAKAARKSSIILVRTFWAWA